MKITVELSLYPLTEDYAPPIKDFIARLKNYKNLKIVTNATSTQIVGEHSYVFEVFVKRNSSDIFFKDMCFCNESYWA